MGERLCCDAGAGTMQQQFIKSRISNLLLLLLLVLSRSKNPTIKLNASSASPNAQAHTDGTAVVQHGL